MCMWGVDEYLNDFRIKVKAESCISGGWANKSNTQEVLKMKIIALGLDPNVTFHFKLSTPRGRVDAPR